MLTNKPTTFKIGVDVDDVLLDTLPTWLDFFNNATNCNIKPNDITDWDITKFVPDEYKNDIYKPLFDPEMWKQVKPIKDSQKYLKEINDLNNVELYIVSATNPFVPKEKWEMFFKYFPFIDTKQLVTTYNKQLLRLFTLIDDKTDNLDDGDILFNRPHNKYDKYPIRTDSWLEIRNIIKKGIQ